MWPPMRLATLGLLPWLAAAQVPNVAGAGYRAPTVKVAPGQIVSVFVRTATHLKEPVIASQFPLPTSLAGFTVILHQTFAGPVNVPLVAVYTAEECPVQGAPNCRPLTAISLQIPYELSPNVPGSRRPENFAWLVVLDQGQASEPLPLSAVPDNAHVVNSCDATTPPQPGPPVDPESCRPAVTHPDGSLVTAENPARAGQVVTIYLYGLGRTEERLPSGAASPSPAEPLTDVRATLTYGANPPAAQPGASAPPAFAGLTPGLAGLYQVNVLLGTPPAGTPPCGAGVPANATVSVGRGYSFAGASFCVAP